MKKIHLLLVATLASLLACHLEETEPIQNSTLAAFSVINDGCIGPCALSFRNESVDANSFEWDFGDGSPFSNEINPSHAYALAGDYLVKLKATGPNGVDTESKTVTVRVLTFDKLFDAAIFVTILQTPDGGYALAGIGNSVDHNGEDAYLMQLNSAGDSVWKNQYFRGMRNEYVSALALASDGNYYIAGSLEETGSDDADVLLVKAAPFQGYEQWYETYGGPNDDYGYAIQETSDGNFVVAGLTYSFGLGGDVYLTKIDPSGTPLWEKNHGGIKRETGNSVRQTNDGGYIIAGTTESIGAGGPDVYVLKTNASGAFEWEQSYGGAEEDQGFCIQKLSNNQGYIIAGLTYSKGAGDVDFYVVKIDLNGTFVWDATYGGASYDIASEIQQTTDGGYIIVGTTTSFGAGLYDIYLVKTDAQGNKQWDRTFGTVGNELGLSVKQTLDGGYIICAGNEVIKTDKSGMVQ